MKKQLNERQEHLEKQKEKLIVFKNLEKDLQILEQQQEKNNNAIQTVLKKQEQNTTLLHRLRDDIKELTTKNNISKKWDHRRNARPANAY